MAGVSCLRGPEPADPKSCKAGSQRPLGLLNLRHIGASPAPAPCFPHPRVAPAEDGAPQGHLPGARTAPWRPAPIPQGRPGMTGRRSGGVAGYENHSSRGQPRDGLRRPGRHLQVRSSPGQTLLLRAPQSAAWTVPRTLRGKRRQAEAVTKAAACVHVHGSKRSGGRDVVGSSAGSEHGSVPATPIRARARLHACNPDPSPRLRSQPGGSDALGTGRVAGFRPTLPGHPASRVPGDEFGERPRVLPSSGGCLSLPRWP